MHLLTLCFISRVIPSIFILLHFLKSSKNKTFELPRHRTFSSIHWSSATLKLLLFSSISNIQATSHQFGQVSISKFNLFFYLQLVVQAILVVLGAIDSSVNEFGSWKNMYYGFLGLVGKKRDFFHARQSQVCPEMHLRNFLHCFRRNIVNVLMQKICCFCEIYEFLLTCCLYLSLFLMQVQWLKITLLRLGSGVCLKLRRYDVRGPPQGPQGHELLITHLMVHLLRNPEVPICLVLITDSLGSLRHMIQYNIIKSS